MDRLCTDDLYNEHADCEAEYDDDDADEWVLSEIRRSRGATLGNPPRRVKEYLCTWVGYDGETTWETRERLIDLGYFSRLSAFEAEQIKAARAKKKVDDDLRGWQFRHISSQRQLRTGEIAMPIPPKGMTLTPLVAEYQTYLRIAGGRDCTTRHRVLESFPALRRAYTHVKTGRPHAFFPRGAAQLLNLAPIVHQQAHFDGCGVYSGMWWRGFRHGMGRMDFEPSADGWLGSLQWYDGEWHHGKMTGHGKCAFRTPIDVSTEIVVTADGEFSLDRLNGECVVSSSTGLAVAGHFELSAGWGVARIRFGEDTGSGVEATMSNLPVGTLAQFMRRDPGVEALAEKIRAYVPPRATRVFDNGTFTGSTRNGHRHGRGRYEWVTGQTYIGMWKDDLMDGEGIHTWPDGRRYTGSFKRDEMHGQGKYEYGDGSYFEGRFRFDNIDGDGTYHTDTGVDMKVHWEGIHPLDAVFLATPAFAADAEEAAPRRHVPKADFCDPLTAANAVPSDLPPPSLLTDRGVDPLCVICQDETKTRAIVPCGHMCLCDACAATGKVTMCPLCRGPADTFLKLYV